MSDVSISLVQGSGALAHNNREYVNKKRKDTKVDNYLDQVKKSKNIDLFEYCRSNK